MINTIATKGVAIALTPFLAFGAFAPGALAKTTDDASASACTELTHTLFFGSRDRNTGGEVSELQAFLKAEGYTKAAASGVFSMNTLRAVRAFQRDNGIMATGFVGPQTRAAIEDQSCADVNEDLEITSIDAPTALSVDEEGEWTVNVNTDPDAGNLTYSATWGDEGMLMRMMGGDEDVQTSATFSHAYSEAGTYTPLFTVTDADGETVTKAAATVTVSEDDETTVSITSSSHAKAYAGQTVTLTGTGFTEDSVVFVGATEVDATYESETSISFVVPNITLGAYDVTVKNGTEVSNAIDLELIKKPTIRISISGIDAPTTLSVDEEGTWTVNADTNASGNLKYSVKWGDEGMFRSMFSSGVTQTSSSFTHSYAEAGTYKPKFTVTDESGKSSSVSATVVVTE